MSEQEISSSRHPMIKQYLRLAGSRRQRHLAAKVAVEGPNLIRESLRAGIVPEALFYTRRYLQDTGLTDPVSDLPGHVRRYVLAPSLFKKISLTDSPQEVAAVIPMPPPFRTPRGAGRVKLGLLLDRLQDPGNFGSIIRTAAASGADGVYYTLGTVDPYSPKVMRSTAGAIFHLPAQLITDPRLWLEELKADGIQIVTTAPGEGRCYWEVDLCPPTVIIIGNESRGVDRDLMAKADCRVSIPQPGWKSSLNAAVAAAIMLYETLRQRRSKTI